METFVPIRDPKVKDNYDVSDCGNVRNRRTGRVLRLQTNRSGYTSVSMMRPNGKPITVTVHRLVANAFVDNPLELRDVNHINGIKADNRVENLEWCSHSDNIIHAQNLGLKKDEKAVRARHLATNEELLFRSTAEAARHFGSHRGNINGVLKGKYRHHKGYQFSYVEENIMQDER